MSGSVGGLLAPLLEANGKAGFFLPGFLKAFQCKSTGKLLGPISLRSLKMLTF